VALFYNPFTPIDLGDDDLWAVINPWIQTGSARVSLKNGPGADFICAGSAIKTEPALNEIHAPEPRRETYHFHHDSQRRLAVNYCLSVEASPFYHQTRASA
jgi:hypothetical protein